MLQDEAYLDAADFEMIMNRKKKKKRRKKRDFTSIHTESKPIKTDTQSGINLSVEEVEVSVPDAITHVKDRLKVFDKFSILSVSL